MVKIVDIEWRIAVIMDIVFEAFVNIEAALRFANYLMQDSEGYKAEERTAENIQKLEGELPNAEVLIKTAIEKVALLKKDLEEQC